MGEYPMAKPGKVRGKAQRSQRKGHIICNVSVIARWKNLKAMKKAARCYRTASENICGPRGNEEALTDG
jgi:hypothetical protein